MRTIRIEVTAEDIREGKPKMCSECPVARAISRAFGGAVFAVASNRTFGMHSFALSGPYRIARLPKHVESFVRQFDCGESVSPFSFDLTLEDA